jgi:hypothetical protein
MPFGNRHHPTSRRAAMSRLHISRPSPALVVATIALIVAMGGTSYAALSLPRNSVGTKQLKNAAVTNAKIKKGAVGTKQIADGAVTKAKLNLTGVTVPSASHATDADHASVADTATHVETADTVGGVNVYHFAVKMSPFGSATLVDTGLITLAGGCVAGGPGGASGVTLAKDNGAPPMAAGITATTGTNTVVNADYPNFVGPVRIDGGMGGSVIHAEVGTTSGKSITINMLFRPPANFFPAENVCLFSGTVMSS